MRCNCERHGGCKRTAEDEDEGGDEEEDGYARTEDLERGALRAVDELLAELHERAERRGRRVELAHLELVHDLPVARRVRVVRQTCAVEPSIYCSILLARCDAEINVQVPDSQQASLYSTRVERGLGLPVRVPEEGSEQRAFEDDAGGAVEHRSVDDVRVTSDLCA